jgi:intron-binding protein aquarius
VRRLTVALSRARLGLYILGRRELFESCYELKQAFDILLQRPTTLRLVPGELAPTQRGIADEAEDTEMSGVEHLGQYVYEMTQAKVAQLNGGGGQAQLPPVVEESPASVAQEEEKEEDVPQPEELDV